MSITLNLEVANGVSLDEIKAVLASVKCSDIVNTESGFTAKFPETNVSISVKTNLSDTSVLTEDIEEPNWEVGLRMYFDIDPTLSNSLDDVRRFVVNLSAQTSFKFALSFQYETLYAKKDLGGLEFSEEF